MSTQIDHKVVAACAHRMSTNKQLTNFNLSISKRTHTTIALTVQKTIEAPANPLRSAWRGARNPYCQSGAFILNLEARDSPACVQTSQYVRTKPKQLKSNRGKVCMTIRKTSS